MTQMREFRVLLVETGEFRLWAPAAEQGPAGGLLPVSGCCTNITSCKSPAWSPSQAVETVCPVVWPFTSPLLNRPNYCVCLSFKQQMTPLRSFEGSWSSLLSSRESSANFILLRKKALWNFAGRLGYNCCFLGRVWWHCSRKRGMPLPPPPSSPSSVVSSNCTRNSKRETSWEHLKQIK